MRCTPHQRSHKVTRYEPLAGQKGEHEFYDEGTETSATDGGGSKEIGASLSAYCFRISPPGSPAHDIRRKQGTSRVSLRKNDYQAD
jgi:hypothetical protein